MSAKREKSNNPRPMGTDPVEQAAKELSSEAAGGTRSGSTPTPRYCQYCAGSDTGDGVTMMGSTSDGYVCHECALKVVALHLKVSPKFIVEAVNAYEGLKEELRRLRKDFGFLAYGYTQLDVTPKDGNAEKSLSQRVSERIEKAEKENQKLKVEREALRSTNAALLKILKKTYDVLAIGDSYQREDHIDNLKRELRAAITQAKSEVRP